MIILVQRILILALSLTASLAAGEHKTVTVVGTGMDSGQVLHNALENAVMAVLSEAYDGRALAMNQAALAKEILADPSRYSVSYEVLELGSDHSSQSYALPFSIVVNTTALGEDAARAIVIKDGQIATYSRVQGDDLAALAAETEALLEGYPWNVVKLEANGFSYNKADKKLEVDISVSLDSVVNDAILRQLSAIADKAAVEPPVEVRRHWSRRTREVEHGEKYFIRGENPGNDHDYISAWNAPSYGHLRLHFANEALTEGYYRYYRLPETITDALRNILKNARWEIAVEVLDNDGARIGMVTERMEGPVSRSQGEVSVIHDNREEDAAAPIRKTGVYNVFPFIGRFTVEDIGTAWFPGKTSYVKTCGIAMDAETAAIAAAVSFTIVAN